MKQPVSALRTATTRMDAFNEGGVSARRMKAR